MWTASASLSGIFPLKTTYEAGFVGAPPQRHPPLNSLFLYCTSPENHILTRGMQSTASPPPTGKMVTQSERFTDDGAAPLKILQSVLSLETILVMGRDVCPWCDCQGERLRYRFPECTGEFGIEEKWPKIPVIWTVRKKSVLSNTPQGWVENFIFGSYCSKTITQVDQTLRANDDEHWLLFFFLLH